MNYTSTYPVQHFRPPFQRDALKHGEHTEGEVVEVRDAVVRTLPVLLVFSSVTTHADTNNTWRRREILNWGLKLLLLTVQGFHENCINL